MKKMKVSKYMRPNSRSSFFLSSPPSFHTFSSISYVKEILPHQDHRGKEYKLSQFPNKEIRSPLVNAETIRSISGKTPLYSGNMINVTGVKAFLPSDRLTKATSLQNSGDSTHSTSYVTESRDSFD